MHTPFAVQFGVLTLAAVASQIYAADWITAPSTYTHANATGQRVAQHTPIGPYYYYDRGDYVRSGYRNYRSSFQFGSSADNYHMVEEWGRPVRPYEEWRFPYRPFSVPFPAWGNPNVGANYGYPAFGGGFVPGIGPGVGGGFNNNQQYPPTQLPPGFGNVPQQWMDGHYPSYDGQDRSQYYQPYQGQRP